MHATGDVGFGMSDFGGGIAKIIIRCRVNNDAVPYPKSSILNLKGKIGYQDLARTSPKSHIRNPKSNVLWRNW
jgi:hypothetical protein